MGEMVGENLIKTTDDVAGASLRGHLALAHVACSSHCSPRGGMAPGTVARGSFCRGVRRQSTVGEMHSTAQIGGKVETEVNRKMNILNI